MKYHGRSFTVAVSNSKEGRENYEKIDWSDNAKSQDGEYTQQQPQLENKD